MDDADLKENLLAGKEQYDRKETPNTIKEREERYKSLIDPPANLKKSIDYKVATKIYDINKIDLESKSTY